jgi:hypothetical protein
MAIAASWSMTILLISWVCTSVAFCLAFLCVASRPVPRMDAQMAPVCESALAQHPGVVLESVRTATPRVDASLPSPCHAA